LPRRSVVSVSYDLAYLRVAAERDALRAAVEDFAKLNCAKPPMGKLYSDPVYRGTCTSCRSRSLLKRLDA
jgi:hypothetical protein